MTVIRRSASVSVQFDNIFAPFPGKEWKKAFRWVKDSGFDAAELILSDPGLLDTDAIRRELDALELGVSTISTGQAVGMENIYMCAGSRLVRQLAQERLMRDIDFAEKFDRANVTVGLIRGRGGELSPQLEEEFLIRELAVVAEYAAKKNIVINLEPINRYECKLINSTEDGYRLLEKMGFPENVGILYDTFHSNIEDADMLQAIRSFGSRFSHVHIADSNRRLPGEGHVDYAAIMATLKEIGYQGYISLEVLNNPSAAHVAEHAGAAMLALR